MKKSIQADKRAGPPRAAQRDQILIVDNDPVFLALLAKFLRKDGFRVLTAKDGALALKILKTVTPDVILLDLVMPNVSGRELAGRFEKLRPGIKVLFMSGYSDNVIEQHGVLEEGTHFIQKPFSPEALARKIRELLVPLADMT